LPRDGQFGQNGTEALQLRTSIQTELIVKPDPFTVTIISSNEDVAPFSAYTKHGEPDLVELFMAAFHLQHSLNSYIVCNPQPQAERILELYQAL